MSKKKGKTVHKEKRHQLANRSPEEIRAEKVKKCFKRNNRLSEMKCFMIKYSLRGWTMTLFGRHAVPRP